MKIPLMKPDIVEGTG